MSLDHLRQPLGEKTGEGDLDADIRRRLHRLTHVLRVGAILAWHA
jgi:hypothetical protein